MVFFFRWTNDLTIHEEVEMENFELSHSDVTNNGACTQYKRIFLTNRMMEFVYTLPFRFKLGTDQNKETNIRRWRRKCTWCTCMSGIFCEKESVELQVQVQTFCRFGRANLTANLALVCSAKVQYLLFVIRCLTGRCYKIVRSGSRFSAACGFSYSAGFFVLLIQKLFSFHPWVKFERTSRNRN